MPYINYLFYFFIFNLKPKYGGFIVVSQYMNNMDSMNMKDVFHRLFSKSKTKNKLIAELWSLSKTKTNGHQSNKL